MTESDYLKQAEMAGHLKVLEVLRRWDPIGVICERNQDEYDSYAVEFINRGRIMMTSWSSETASSRRSSSRRAAPTRRNDDA